MKEKDFNKLLESVSQAGAIKRGEAKASRCFVDVEEIRSKLGMTQEQFSTITRVSIKTLQNWEQKRRAPSGAALSLLTIFKNHPKAAIDALKKGL
jgi:putative transcriptional regulator